MQLRRCTSIFILFLCGLVASCGKNDTAVVPSEGPAGQVRELHGTVTATRAGQKPRTLAESDTIFVNDSLHTADDASIVILFAHNNARWQLGSGYQGKVVDSLAWRTKRHEASALVRTEHTQTAAAGRDSEREAAESVETLEFAPVMDTLAPEPAAEPKPPGEATDRSAPYKGESDKDTRQRKPAPRKPKYKPEPPSPAPARSRPPAPVAETAPAEDSAPGGNDDDEAFVGGLGIRSIGKAGGETAKGDGDSEKNRDPVGGKRKMGNKPENTKRDKPARSTSKSQSSTIKGIGKTCSDKFKEKGSVTVLLTVTNSQISRLEVTGSSTLAKTKKCIKSQLRATKYQGSSSDRVTITL